MYISNVLLKDILIAVREKELCVLEHKNPVNIIHHRKSIFIASCQEHVVNSYAMQCLHSNTSTNLLNLPVISEASVTAVLPHYIPV